MAATPEIIAGIAIGAFLGFAAGLALPPGPADAGYGVAYAPAPQGSNLAAKADRLATATPRARKALEVAQVQRIGDDFALLDAKGRIVYRSARDSRTTTVVKDAHVPLVTGYGVAVSRAGN